MNNLRADEILSKSTQVSGRSLVIVSSVSLFVRFSGLKLSELGVFKTIEASDWDLAVGTVLILMFLLLSHSINWNVDARTYIRSEGEVTMHSKALGVIEGDIDHSISIWKTVKLKRAVTAAGCVASDLSPAYLRDLKSDFDVGIAIRLLLMFLHYRVPMLLGTAALLNLAWTLIV